MQARAGAPGESPGAQAPAHGPVPFLHRPLRVPQGLAGDEGWSLGDAVVNWRGAEY